MEYCREGFRDVWIVIDNPKYEGERCPCCGRKFPKEANKYLVVDGFFCRIETDGDRIDYIAEYTNPVTEKDEEAVISHYYVNFNENEDGELEIDPEDVKDLANHSIFDLSYCFDEGPRAFKTKEEAEKWVEEFGAD